MDLQVTDNVFNRINVLLKNQQTHTPILRVSVEGGGCAGFMYKYEFVDKIEPDDYVIKKEGVQIIIDPSSIEFIKGCTIDFIEELGAAYFHITNPNAVSKCGCNNSFSV